jgi:hypothetical protein
MRVAAAAALEDADRDEDGVISLADFLAFMAANEEHTL